MADPNSSAAATGAATRPTDTTGRGSAVTHACAVCGVVQEVGLFSKNQTKKKATNPAFKLRCRACTVKVNGPTSNAATKHDTSVRVSV